MNKYDPRVVNKNINGSQCTICWYVDNVKISHKDKTVVTDVIQILEGKFGKVKVKRGIEHEFVGMKIKLLPDGNVSIITDEYIEECIDVFREELEGKASG